MSLLSHTIYTLKHQWSTKVNHFLSANDSLKLHSQLQGVVRRKYCLEHPVQLLENTFR